MSSNQMLNQFINYLLFERNRAKLTVEAYRNDISQFSEWLGIEDSEKTDFESVSSSDVRAWLASLAREGNSPRTIRRKAQSLRALFIWMVKTGKIKVSPLRDMPLPKVPRHLPDIVKAEEIETAIKTGRENTDESEIRSIMEVLIVEMLYSLGLRRAELVSLNDSDVSIQDAEIKITGKRSKQRIVPLPQTLLDKITNWQQLRDKKIENQTQDSPLFILKGQRIKDSQVYYIVKKFFSNSSAKKKSPHALRHSFASGMLNGGANLDSVREFLGHASLATTQIYTHISLNEIKKAYNNAHPRSNNSKNK